MNPEKGGRKGERECGKMGRGREIGRGMGREEENPTASRRKETTKGRNP